MNDKLKKYLEKLALSWSPFGSAWNSSAKDLEEDLAKRGIKMKLYYEYALPENMTPQVFMTRIAVLDLCAKVLYFSKVKMEIFFDKKLNLIEKFRLVKYIASERGPSQKKIDEYVKFVQNANPELAKLKKENDFDKFDILAGAAFGFGPKEIEYFMKRKERREAIDSGYERDMYKKFEQLGIRLQYVLAPETANAIMKELNKTMVAINTQNTVRTI